LILDVIIIAILIKLSHHYDSANDSNLAFHPYIHSPFRPT
jgi:hypothetical protein